MTIAVSIDQLARRLDAYQEQLTALSQALGALREISDNLIIAMQADRTAMAEHTLAAQASTPVAPPTSDASEPTGASDNTAEPEADDAIVAEVLSVDANEQEIEAPVAEHAAEEASGGIIETTLAPEAETVAEAIDTNEPAEAEAAQQIAETLASVAQIAASATEEPPAIVEAPAAGDEQPIVEVAFAANLDSEIEPASATEAHPEAVASVETTAAPAIAEVDAAAPEASASNVVDLAAARRKGLLGTPARRRFAAIAAMLVVTAGATFGFNELIHTELGQRLIELGTCDADMLSANRDCAFLSWLTL